MDGAIRQELDPAAGIAGVLAEARRGLAQGQVGEARRLAEAVLGRDPGCFAAMLLANQAAFIAGDLAAAMQHVDAGLRRFPESADLHLRRARCLLAWNDPAAARTALGVATGLGDAGAPAPWGMIGDALVLTNDFDAARAAYGKAIAAEPVVAEHRFNRGVVARYLGDTGQARGDCEATVALRADHGEAWLNLVHLRRQRADDNRIDAMAAVLGRSPATAHGQRQAVRLHYALAKSFEDLGDGGRCFAHLDAGAQLMRRSLRYNVQGDIDIMALLTSAEVPERGGFSGLRPIFVLGLPRSGSTMVERILSSHSEVGTVGESTAFGRALAEVAQALGIDPGDGAAIVRAIPRLDPAAIGRRYAELTAPWRGDEAHFVDKLPNNHAYVGLIARALPEARIVHVTREPVANLFGIYKTLFNQAYPWSYDLDELVAYYAGYRRLMAHWREAVGERLIELPYERLIDDPDATIRGLIAACGLDWQEACGRFHENRRPCTTQSASQIRAPLNRDGVEGWRRFAAQLAPLRDRLARLGLADAG